MGEAPGKINGLIWTIGWSACVEDKIYSEVRNEWKEKAVFNLNDIVR